MKYESIGDVYSANKRIHDRLRPVVAGISEREAIARPDGEKWSIQELVEHISIVESAIAGICSKLIEAAKADGKPADGTLALSEGLMQKWAGASDVKLEAPERVQPTGNVSIAGALEKMAANRDVFDAMRNDFETYDLSRSWFPHPYFGDLTATEWLILSGGHEARHTAQIERLLEKIRQ
jgi:hypothetical protein